MTVKLNVIAVVSVNDGVQRYATLAQRSDIEEVLGQEPGAAGEGGPVWLITDTWPPRSPGGTGILMTTDEVLKNYSLPEMQSEPDQGPTSLLQSVTIRFMAISTVSAGVIRLSPLGDDKAAFAGSLRRGGFLVRFMKNMDVEIRIQYDYMDAPAVFRRSANSQDAQVLREAWLPDGV